MIPPMLKRLGLPAAGTAVLIATATVSYFEGHRNEAYLDPVGIPTICNGHTQGVQLGQTRTDKECAALLAGDLGEALDVVNDAVHVPMTPQREAALASFVYNVGSGAFRGSSLLRKLNAGNVVGACNELSRWVYAGGKRLAGLVTRREAERQLCLMGTGETRLAGTPAGGGS